MNRKQYSYLIRINGKLVEYKDAFELQQILLKRANEQAPVPTTDPKPFPDDKDK